MTPEGKVKKDIIKWLEDLEKQGLPIFHQVRSAGGLNYKKGIPDIYVVYNGRHIEIEVKAPDGNQSTMQEKYQQIFGRLNIPYLLIADVGDLKEKFLKLMEVFS